MLEELEEIIIDDTIVLQTEPSTNPIKRKTRHDYVTLFLRSDNEQDLKNVAKLQHVSFRYLGKISRPTGATTTELIDGEEVEVPVYEELPHYHANLLVCTCCMQDTIDAVADVTIECPNTPSEVFA